MRIVVSAAPPCRPLSVGLPGAAGSRGTATPEPAPDTSDIHPAVFHFGRRDGAARPAGRVRSAGYVPTAAGEPAPTPALSSAVREPDQAQVRNATEDVRRIDTSNDRTEPLSQRAEARTDVAVQLAAPFCSTLRCPATVDVTNQGTAPASGSVIVTVAGAVPLNSPVSLPPCGERTLPMAARNVAPPGQTVRVNWSAVFYEASVMGNDPALAKRLMDRGFKLNEPLGNQLANDSKTRPVLQLLGAMMPGIGPQTGPAVRERTGSPPSAGRWQIWSSRERSSRSTT